MRDDTYIHWLIMGEKYIQKLGRVKATSVGLLPDTYNCGLRMRGECWERFPRHRFKRKQLLSDPGMHHGAWVTHVPWCMSGSVARGGGGKRSRHSRRMRNTKFYVSGNSPMEYNSKRHLVRIQQKLIWEKIQQENLGDIFKTLKARNIPRNKSHLHQFYRQTVV